ncbi:hypothetical protein [Emticicia sp. 21SJ11W-3]|uniref:hypothetical protein n=1 Tax=Emticicia sp. 21SJ11W-3 TaxID=2916755 RepID=UPI0020A05004|nr:hypothetical protein [Emticicia sp. 21SJ11W-3]UTA66656.1 hypothetical protein MB380_13705 [Emticicia sp. 21SJ11W-3]
MMQNFQESDLADKLAFATKLEDISGGITIAAADFTDGTVVQAGSVVGKDNNGLYHVLKTARLHTAAGNTATSYLVFKGHGFKTGDFIAALTGAKAYAITGIDTSNADYDTLTVATTLGVAVAQYGGVFQAAAEATTNTSAFKVTPFAVTGHAIKVKAGETNAVDAWLRATLFEANAPVATAQMKAALPQILWV